MAVYKKIPTINKDINWKDLYRFYRKVLGGRNIKKRDGDFPNIMSDFNQMVMDLVRDGHEVYLPEKTGVLAIVGNKTSRQRPPVNWPKTRAYWKKYPEKKAAGKTIAHTNEHSDNMKFTHVWSKSNVITQFAPVYSFQVARDNMERLARKVLDEGKEYQDSKDVKYAKV